MSKPWLFLVIGGAIAAAAFVPLAMVAFVFLPIVMERMAPTPLPQGVTPICEGEPQGVTLIYEVDPKSVPDVSKVDMTQLIARIDSRLNSEPRPLTRVRQLDGGHIEVTLYSTNFTASQYVDQLLQRAGTLEFRILANKRDHKAIIEQAMAKDNVKVHNAAGELLAWWVPIAPGKECDFSSYADIITRKTEEPNRDCLEVLVVNDTYNVNGTYLDQVHPGVDRSGRPCVNIFLTSAGGQLLGMLTKKNLPDRTTDFTRKLGVILDGKLYTAPMIQGTIYDRAEITGSFTRQEVVELASVLNSRPLPARIRLLKEKDSP